MPPPSPPGGNEPPARSVRELVHERANRFGPIPFDEYMELALYATAAGFYEAGGAAGTGRGGAGDFLTSPEAGPLFGGVVARALDSWWRDLGHPDPFIVVEAGAGTGALCRAILDAAPECAGALRYLLVERSDRLRSTHAVHLPVELAAHVLGPVAPADEEDEGGARVLPGGGPRIASLPDLPASAITGVVIANELLDNLPFALLERQTAGWAEVRVTAAVTEALVPAVPALADEAYRLAPSASVGARIPIQHRAAAWIRDGLRTLGRGRLVVIDYAVDATAELASRPWSGWVRTYRRGAPGGTPYDAPGDQDITCDVCIDQLARVAPPDRDRTQTAFLEQHGIRELAAEASGQWRAGAAAASLDALKAKSRVSEAAALTDPSGLGAFRVIEWSVGGDPSST